MYFRRKDGCKAIVWSASPSEDQTKAIRNTLRRLRIRPIRGSAFQSVEKEETSGVFLPSRLPGTSSYTG